jgi:hypothetical protein
LSSSHPKKQTNKNEKKDKEKRREGRGERGRVDHPAIIDILQTSLLNAFKFYFVLRFEK